MTVPKDAEIFVEQATLVGGHTLALTFSEGTRTIINFSGFLKSSGNPQIRAYLEPSAFARFAVKDGDLVWDDYELCFPIADLYEGRI
ncbi:MAG: DUF2442 domain-containing protein [Tepidisphaeraceae bacterium]|jgi:hypothetical protein